jgi:putative hemolysin
LRSGAYAVRLARSEEDRRAAFRLRFIVFNLELNEGLESAYVDGFDEDEFDAACDHLLVEHQPTSTVVGTYRLQTGPVAASNSGYYSAREFSFEPYESFREEVLELGRACVHAQHRSFEVLTLLWRGICQYAAEHSARYLIGCSSLTSQDPAAGSAMYHRLSNYLVTPELRTTPIGDFAFPIAKDSGLRPEPPKLLRTYLAVGAKICGPPAIDREFKTIDFLTFMDLEDLPSTMRTRLLGRRAQ